MSNREEGGGLSPHSFFNVNFYNDAHVRRTFCLRSLGQYSYSLRVCADLFAAAELALAAMLIVERFSPAQC